MKIGSNDVLLVVDVQNDFCTGSLAIPGAEAIVPIINRLSDLFSNIVITQDWHPVNHVSFASAHPGKRPGDTIQAAYGPQKVYADHCVQGAWGAQLHPGLELTTAELVLRKGARRAVDSFSAVVENDRKTTTGLAAFWRCTHPIDAVERVMGGCRAGRRFTTRAHTEHYAWQWHCRKIEVVADRAEGVPFASTERGHRIQTLVR